jgi:hypothetical protein
VKSKELARASANRETVLQATAGLVDRLLAVFILIGFAGSGAESA